MRFLSFLFFSFLFFSFLFFSHTHRAYTHGGCIQYLTLEVLPRMGALINAFSSNSIGAVFTSEKVPPLEPANGFNFSIAIKSTMLPISFPDDPSTKLPPSVTTTRKLSALPRSLTQSTHCSFLDESLTMKSPVSPDETQRSHTTFFNLPTYQSGRPEAKWSPQALASVHIRMPRLCALLLLLRDSA